MIAVDPLDPQKIVSVWMNNDTPDIAFTASSGIRSKAPIRIDGGKDWTTFLNNNLNEPLMIDPASPPTSTVSNICRSPIPVWRFDRSGNFYVLMSEHNAAGTSGAIVLQKYNFAAGSPAIQRFRLASRGGASTQFNIINQWLPGDDAAVAPTMAVDDNVPSFTDPVDR